jgi:hypothetical protein
MTLQLKDIEPAFANQVKSFAYGRGQTLKEFIVEAVRRALENGGVAGPKGGPRRSARRSKR